MIALLFLIVVNVADFHQAGAASSAPSWMREGAYTKYKSVGTYTPPTFYNFLRNLTTYELIEFVAVHEHTVGILWKVGRTSQVEDDSGSGYLDLEWPYDFQGTLYAEYGSVQTPLIDFFWVTPERLDESCKTGQACIRPVPVTGFPPDSSKYAGVKCRAWSQSWTTPDGGNGVGHLWYDTVTNLLVEMRAELNTDAGSAVWIETLYETNIPVGNQALVSVETYPSVFVAVAVVCLAAVGFAMFRKRTAIVCGQCGRKMRRGSIFCDKCGTRMPDARRA